jgi:asparagine synthase (glutamine-hydrolysing)
MCGLTGIFEYQRTTDVSRELIHCMNETIVHRGPDDEGIFVGPGVGLGFRRLSIIDLSGGHQPISNEDGSIWVMLNGEIYNYRELRKDLDQKGHTFATHSDTESIVHLYEEYGEDCFARLRGMFAIILWDSKQRKLLMARDRVGKKPLFYSANAKRILFGSELKALLASNDLDRELDAEALCDYFSFGYIPAPKSIYRSVRKLLPGHYIVVSGDGCVREQSYWKLSFAETESHSEAEWCERIRHELCEATRVRLMSDVPLGAFLSGGIDSSSIVATMARLMNKPVTSCSIGFDVPEFDESKYARQVAEQFHTDHHEQTVEPDAVAIVDKLAWHYDEPFADSSAIPTYYVSAVARKQVTVALGGDGGDENFAGYRRYQFDVMENRIRARVPEALRSSVFGPLGRWYPALAWAPRIFRAKATFQSLSRNPLEGYFNSISIFRVGEKSRLLQKDFQDRLGGYDSIEVLKQHYDQAGTDDPLSRIQYVDIKTYLADDILAKVDRASMAVSLEVRAPLLDHRLMETVARIPSSLKLRGLEGKYILKKAMESTLSREILYRAKQGFAVPLAHWFRHELKDMARETIFDSQDGVLDRKYLEKIWNEHQRNTFDRSAYLWSVLMFRKWQKTFATGAVA